MDRKLKTIPEPKPNTRTVIETKAGRGLPIFKGTGDHNLLCGNCDTVLVEGMGGQIRNMVIHCPICSHFNEIP